MPQSPWSPWTPTLFRQILLPTTQLCAIPKRVSTSVSMTGFLSKPCVLDAIEERVNAVVPDPVWQSVWVTFTPPSAPWCRVKDTCWITEPFASTLSWLPRRHVTGEVWTSAVHSEYMVKTCNFTVNLHLFYLPVMSMSLRWLLKFLYKLINCRLFYPFHKHFGVYCKLGVYRRNPTQNVE